MTNPNVDSPINHTPTEIALFQEYADLFAASPVPTSRKLQAFAKYVRRQDLSRFLARNELFKLQLNIPGEIVECGCFQGGGTLTFAQLSAIYEPFNMTRKVIAFDTFSGFPDVSVADANGLVEHKPGELYVCDRIEEEIMWSAALLDKNRPLAHFPKVELVKGDAVVQMPQYLVDNPHLIVSMLYLDFDLYEPTKVALETFLGRMPKGAIIAFDELNMRLFPGETLALLVSMGIGVLRLTKTQFDPYISYAERP